MNHRVSILPEMSCQDGQGAVAWCEDCSKYVGPWRRNDNESSDYQLDALEDAAEHAGVEVQVCARCYTGRLSGDCEVCRPCDWCHSQHDVQRSGAEHLCLMCRAVVAHAEILSAVK